MKIYLKPKLALLFFACAVAVSVIARAEDDETPLVFSIMPTTLWLRCEGSYVYTNYMGKQKSTKPIKVLLFFVVNESESMVANYHADKQILSDPSKIEINSDSFIKSVRTVIDETTWDFWSKFTINRKTGDFSSQILTFNRYNKLYVDEYVISNGKCAKTEAKSIRNNEF